MICFCGTKFDNLIINKNEYFSCPNCGLLKKKNILSKSDEKARYDMHITDDKYVEYMHKIYDDIKPYLVENGSSIDYGCGKIHALSDILNSNNYKCDYYDLYYYNNIEFKKYDNIILIEVFEHIEDSFKLFKELDSILNENGRIIIMTNPIPDKLDNWWYLRDSTHITFVYPKTMEMLARLTGFKCDFIKEKSLFIFSRENR